MGFIKEAKKEAIAKDAAEAFASDAMFYTPIINMPAFKLGFSGNVLDIAMMTEAIVRTGWQLHTWAVCSDDKGRPQAMPLFVRPIPRQPVDPAPQPRTSW